MFLYFSYGLNWGFAYELPTNASDFGDESIKKIRRSIVTKPMMQRRQRRDLYSRMEIVMGK